MTAASFPSDAALRFVRRALDEAERVHVPRLHALCAELRREVLACEAAPLLEALQDHRGGAGELRRPRRNHAGLNTTAVTSSRRSCGPCHSSRSRRIASAIAVAGCSFTRASNSCSRR